MLFGKYIYQITLPPSILGWGIIGTGKNWSSPFAGLHFDSKT